MTGPGGLDPAIQTREIVFDAEADLVTPFLKLATVSRVGAGHMTFASDEGPNLGGLGYTTLNTLSEGMQIESDIAPPS